MRHFARNDISTAPITDKRDKFSHIATNWSRQLYLRYTYTFGFYDVIYTYFKLLESVALYTYSAITNYILAPVASSIRNITPLIKTFRLTKYTPATTSPHKYNTPLKIPTFRTLIETIIVILHIWHASAHEVGIWRKKKKSRTRYIIILEWKKKYLLFYRTFASSGVEYFFFPTYIQVYRN